MQDHLSSALRDKIEILTLIQDDETGNMAWAPSRKRWGSVEIDRQRNLFSIVGVGSRGGDDHNPTGSAADAAPGHPMER